MDLNACPFRVGDVVIDDDGYESKVVGVRFDEEINEVSADSDPIFSIVLVPVDEPDAPPREELDFELTLVERPHGGEAKSNDRT
jgi:hypothetical protein